MTHDPNKQETMQIVPSGAALGAEIIGLDLSYPLSAKTVAAVRMATVVAP